jgi:hypothetical protein
VNWFEKGCDDIPGRGQPASAGYLLENKAENRSRKNTEKIDLSPFSEKKAENKSRK